MSRPSNLPSGKDAGSGCKIFMVGFPTTLPDSKLSTVVDMVGHLVPEASVVAYELLDPGENVSAGSSGHGTNIALPLDWIFTEARSLLEKMPESLSKGEEIILSGYGLGGIVAKQAVMTANTNPNFYHLASQISSLIFFDVPHESAGHQPWEGLLLNLIKTTPSVKLQNSLYSAVSRLARRVSELSTSFSKFEPKYRIMNIVPHHDHERTAPMRASDEELSSWLNSLQRTVQWPMTVQMGSCKADDIPSLRLLRMCFMPSWNNNNVDSSPSPHRLDYIDALKMLSPSTRIIYESMAPDAVDTMKSLKAVYDLEFQQCKFARVRGGIVYVTAPGGRGKSAVVELLSRHLQAQVSLVVIDNFPGLLSDAEHPTVFYSLMISTLHQILSQKPSLLTRPVQTLMNELRQRDAWGEAAVQNLLAVLFASCSADFLVVVHDYGSPWWPDEARQWWSGLVDDSSETRRPGASTCTLLISGTGLENDKHPSGRNSCHRIDLTENYEQKKDEFIRRECARILSEIGSASSDFLRGTRGIDIQNEIVTRVLNLPGSFSEIGRYLDHLLRGFTLSTPRAILRSIGPSPETADEFYQGQVTAVLHGMDEEVLSWTTAVLSWVFMSTRPLQVQELAEAVAIDPDQGQPGVMDETVTLDIERDIHRNLAGLLSVENGYVRIASPTARTALGTSGTSALKLLGHDVLVIRCLRYLSMALGQQPARRATGTAFVDYAVRSWPAHFLRIAKPSKSLCTEVAAFLRSSLVANRWFQLYMASNDSSQVLACLHDRECQFLSDEIQEGLGLKPAEMAAHAGLWPVVSFLRAEHDAGAHDGSNLPKMLVRRGGVERQMVFFDGTGSKLYLECAIASDDVEAVRALVDGVDEKTIERYCPLHLAAFMGSPGMVAMLLEKKSVRKSGRNSDDRGRTALHMVALGGQSEILELLQESLVEGDADIYSLKDTNSDTPLLLATRAGNVAVAKLFLDLSERQGVWMDDTTRKNPAHYAIESCPELLEYLLTGSTASELTKGDHDGLTLLHLAARSGSVDVVETVLKAALTLVKGVTKMDLDTNFAHQLPSELLSEMLSESEALLRRAAEKSPESMRGSASAGATDTETGRFILPQTLKRWGGHSAFLLYPMVGGLPALEGLETDENREKMLLDLLSWLNQSLIQNPEQSSGSILRRFRFLSTHRQLVRFLSKSNPPVLGRVMLVVDHNGRLPIHHAAENGQHEVLELLIREMNGYLRGWGDLMRKHRDLSDNAPGDLAAGRGHIDALEVLYPDKTTIDLSILAAAAGAGQLLTVEYLLQRGMHPDGEPESGHTPLGLASAGGFGQVVRSLLRCGADVNLTNQGRKTPLYLAVQHKRHEVVEILLPHPRALGDGAGGRAPTSTVMVDSPDASRLTPLHVAASAGDERLIKLLLRRGANVESRSTQRQTPLHLAVRAKMQQAAHILVFEHGASLTALDQDDQHPVWYAVDRRDAPMVKALLLFDPEDPNGGNVGSRYPLEFQRRDVVRAVERSAREVVDFLLTRYPEAARSPDITNRSPDSLLHIAARGSNADMVNQLLSFDLNPNLAGSEGRTPLHVSAAYGNVEATKALLVAKADPSSTDKDGKTPLLLACVAEKDASETCKALLDGGAAVDDKGQYWRTPLFQASYYGQDEVVEVLLDPRRGADVDWRDNDSWSSLHAAADNSVICQKLIAAGADINYQKSDGWTPLHMACSWGIPKTVECLLKNGAKANLLNTNGETPLHIAVRQDAHSIVKVMVGHGRAGPKDENPAPLPDEDNVVDVQARTAGGSTCIDIAAENAYPGILETLLEAADWDYEDLVSPYWKVIEKDTTDCLKPLIKKERRLLDASRLKGHDDSAQIAVEGAQVVLRLFHLAIDRRDKDLWDTLVELDSKSKVLSGTHDEDGWALDDYICQARPGVDFIQNSDRVPVRGITLEPSAVLFPKAWSNNVSYQSPRKRMEIEENGLMVKFKENETHVCLRSDHPFPPQEVDGSPYRYFELAIQTREPPHDDKFTITIGFCSEFSDMAGAHTGWRERSVGYHSDDGGLFEGSGSTTKEYKKYGSGSTVGCGIDYAEGKYFFTLDGDIIIEKKSDLIYRKIYPCLSHRHGTARVRVNFGPGGFMWTGATLDEETAEGDTPQAVVS